MNKFMKKTMVILLVLMLVFGAAAYAQSVISTTVVMRVSRMTQNAVVNVGEDLSMEVNIGGVDPDSYQWYFNGEKIVGATQKVYSIVNAQMEDSGVYRMDAFDASGRMLVSMDISARVIDRAIPQSGDGSMPVGVAVAAFILAASGALLVLRRKVKA